MAFEDIRALFSHSLLENLLFPYVCGPSDVWRFTASQDTDNARAAAEEWRTVPSSCPQGVRRIPEIWKTYCGDGVIVQMRKLYECATQRAPFVLTDKFMAWEEVHCWLMDMDRFVNLIESDGFEYVPGRENDAYVFWKAALKLYRFVQGLRYGTPGFWELYKEQR